VATMARCIVRPYKRLKGGIRMAAWDVGISPRSARAYRCDVLEIAGLDCFEAMA